LLLNTDAYAKIGTMAQINPPLRSPHDNEVLWQALLDGVIDFIIVGGKVVYDHGKLNKDIRGQALTFSPN
jgi:hypothetical protein